jgi:hypothetical protein
MFRIYEKDEENEIRLIIAFKLVNKWLIDHEASLVFHPTFKSYYPCGTTRQFNSTMVCNRAMEIPNYRDLPIRNELRNSP